MKNFISSLVVIVIASCGANPYKTYEKKDPAEDATVALEDNDADKAISILTDALADDPDNNTFKSILALAYAQRAGIDPLTIAQRMGGNTSSASTSGNGLTSLFGIMPAATDAAIADVDTALVLLNSIPTDQRITADNLKFAMFQIAAMTLRSKQLDTDGDGVLSTEELLQMSTASAAAILSQLASAAGAYSGSTSSSTTDKAASEQISKIQTAIQGQPGATDQEKLQSYLGKTTS